MNAKVRGITVTINGDTKGLGKVLDAAKKQSMGLSKELREVNKALKLNPSSVTLLSEKQGILADSVKAAREELKALEAAQGDVEKMYAAGDIDRGAYLEFQRKLESARDNLKRLQDQQVEFGGVVGQIMQQAGQKVTDFGNKVEGVGNKLAPISAATAAAGAATVKMAWDFEDSMAKVSTIADATEVPLAELEAAILELSDETGIAAGEIAENVYNAISAGQQTADAVNFVRHNTNLARAGFAETGAALDLLTTILNAYGLEADKVTEVSDMLITTQNLGKTTVAELSAAMGKVIPTAKSQGVTLDELCGSYAVMTANGIATAETTTYLNSMLNELGKEGTTAADAFAKGTEHIKEGGLTMAEAMEQGWALTDVLSVLDEQAHISGTTISNMFGSAEAGKAATVLWDNAAKLNDAVDQMGESANATSVALEKLDTNNQKAKIAFNQVKNAALDFGQVASGMLAPFITTLAGHIESATQKLNSMDEGQKKTIVTIAAVVAAAGPLLMITGKVISTVGTVITVGGKVVSLFSGVSAALKSGATAASLAGTGAKVLGGAMTLLSNPVTATIAVVGALIGIFTVMYNKCEWFREGVDNLVSGAVDIWNTCMDGLKSSAEAGLSALQTTTQQKLDAVRSAYESNGGGVRGIVAATMTAIQEAHTFGFDYIDKLTGGKLSSLERKFKDCMNNAKTTVSSGIEKLKKMFDFSWSLPQIKLPHFTVTGGEAPWGFGGKGSLPKVSVSWYKEGGILHGAQLFGMLGSRLLGGGEAGPEAVLPLRSFYDELTRILDRKLSDGGNGPAQFNQYNTYNSPKDLSPAECARQTRNETRKLIAAVKKR